MRKPALVGLLVVLVLGVTVGAIALATTSGDTSTYWVDGARPDAETAEKVTTGTEGCVPYSAERPDVHICGQVPAGYVPPPVPGYDSTKCRQAEEVYAGWQADMAAAGASKAEIEDFYPAIDPATCIIDTLNTSNGPGYDFEASFKPATGDGPTVRVPVDTG